MSAAHVQSATPVTDIDPGPTGPPITLSGVVAGNEIVVWGSWGTSDATPTCADDKGNPYSSAQGKTWDGTNTQGLCGFAGKATTGGTVVITVSWTGSKAYRTVFAEEKSGIDTTTDIDCVSVGQAQPNPGTGDDGLSSTAFTTVTANALICACSANIASAAIPDVGLVGVSRSSSSAGVAMRSEDWDAGAAGSKTSNFTAGIDDRHLTAQMALRPAAGAPAQHDPFVTVLFKAA